MRKTNNQITRVPSFYLPCDSELSVEQWMLVSSLESVFSPRFSHFFSPIVVSFSYLSPLVNSYTHSKAQLACLLLSGGFLGLPLPIARQNKPLLSQHLEQIRYTATACRFVYFPSWPGVSKLSHEPHMACCLLFTICELGIDFTFQMVKK